MAVNAEAGAEGLQGTGRAARREGPADRLPEGDEEVVVRDPVLLRESVPEGEFGLLGRFGFYDPEPVRNPVDVRVHTDSELSEAERQNKIGRFSSYSL